MPEPTTDRVKVVIRELGTDVEVHSFPVRPGTDPDKVMAGLVAQMDTDRYVAEVVPDERYV